MNVRLNMLEYLKNPKIFFIALTIICLVILFFVYNFEVVPYYTDKSVAEELLNSSLNMTIQQVDSVYLNRRYFFFNGLYHISVICACCSFYALIFNIRCFNDFLNIKIIKNKIFSYSFINVFYLFWAFYMQKILEIDLAKYIYYNNADSFGVAFFCIALVLLLFGVMYYIFINILNFIVYNTKIANKFFIWLYRIILLCFLLYMMSVYTIQFSWYFVIIYLLELLFIIYLLNSIVFLKNKFKSM